MDENSYLLAEYNSLREEIKETKARLFKLAGFALLGLPSMSAAAELFRVDALAVVLPGIIVATMLLYLSESSSLMRCGSYLKQRIEQPLRDGGSKAGWEHWLAEDTKGADDCLLAGWACTRHPWLCGA